MLLADGHDVVGVDNMNEYYDPALKQARLRALGIEYKGKRETAATHLTAGSLTFIRAGVEDSQLYSRHLDCRHFDAVCHLAAQAGVRYSITNPEQYISANLDGFFHILEYSRRNPSMKLVYASSSSVYGNSGDKPLSETDATDNPVSLYAATKKANEVMAYSYSSLYGITSIGLRFFTVYGPWGRPDMAPFLFTWALLYGEPINVFNRGDMQPVST